jgi:hypothetical protein
MHACLVVVCWTVWWIVPQIASSHSIKIKEIKKKSCAPVFDVLSSQEVEVSSLDLLRERTLRTRLHCLSSQEVDVSSLDLLHEKV